jgi:glycyl-tRNA synthetase
LTSPIPDKYNLLSETAKRRGFFWNSFEIYGGVSGFIDLGPLGIGLRNQIVNHWRDVFLRPYGFVEVATPIITPHRVLEASGHVANFKDPMTECTNCHRRFRADQLAKERALVETEGMSLEELGKLIEEKGVRCPECNGVLGRPQYFLTMFKTTIGPYGEDLAYGRPEAAQGIFADFRRIYEVMRERFPLGIAQIGTVLRNEISPRQGPIRLREFTIMDFELFYDPNESNCPFLESFEEDSLSIVTEAERRAGKDDGVSISTADALRSGTIKTAWAAFFMCLAKRFLEQLGIDAENQRFFEKMEGERAHYSRQTFDLEVKLDKLGWTEVAGFAYRADYDLQKHMEATGQDMRVFKAFDKPVERKSTKVTLRHDRLRQVFGSDAGRVAAVLADVDLQSLLKAKTGKISVGGYDIPVESFELREETIKESGSKFVPFVVEPSFGVERLVYAALEYSMKMKEDRLVLALPFNLAPTQASVFPLVNRDGLPEKAAEIYKALLSSGIRAEYDEAGSIGRRYARADEAGTPLGVTVDYDTLKGETVTLRDRDSWRQIRVPVRLLPSTITEIGRTHFPRD